jgi:hypothetical protein
MRMNNDEQQSSSEGIQVPASRGGPLVAAFGLTMVFAGLVTHVMVSILGAAALLAGLIAWFREVLPHEAHELVPLEKERLAVAQPHTKVRHLEVGQFDHRARLPLKIYPYSAGVRGGLVGGAAMAVLAVLYGLIGHHSIWYPINLLAAAGSAQISAMSYNQLLAFNGTALILGTIIHVVGSALVGLLYGVALPIFPRRPMLLGGVLAPLFWSGILYAEMGIINPVLQQRIDWKWFIASQFAFGLVAGFVVAKHERISTMQHLPFVVRAGFEAAEVSGEEGEEESKP